MSAQPRGVCPVCHSNVAVTSDGVLRPDRRRCPGAGRPPARKAA